MLDNNIMSPSVSEAAKKIPIDENDYKKCSYMCLVCRSTGYKITEYQYNSRKGFLSTRIHPV